MLARAREAGEVLDLLEARRQGGREARAQTAQETRLCAEDTVL